MKNIIRLALFMLSVSFILTACKKDDDPVAEPPPVTNEPEMITTVKILFTDSAGLSPAVSATFSDPDGDGGNPPSQVDTIKLLPNTTYYAEILLLDVSKNPVDTISNEVADEANDHMFFFHTSGAAIMISYNDQDTNNPPLPIGLETKWRTTSAGNGSAQVIMKHQPGVKDGTETPGNTDVDVTFPLKVQ